MSSFHLSRIQSAHPRSVQRTHSAFPPSNALQRANTSINIHDLDTSKIKLPTWRPVTGSQSTPSSSIVSATRPKTSSVSTMSLPRYHFDDLPTREVELLLRCLERDEKHSVRVNSLADYRKLVQAVNIRRTPLDLKSLCALQQRENRIVQRNACRDVRFRLLVDSLSPSHKMGEIDEDDTDFSEVAHPPPPGYPVGDASIVY